MAGRRDAVAETRAADAEMIGVATLELRRGACGIPEVAHRGGQIEISPAARQGLADIDFPLAARALDGVGTRACERRLPGRLRIAEGIVSAGGVAIGRDGDVGVGVVEQLAVAQTQALAAGGIGVRDGGSGLRYVGRDGTQQGSPACQVSAAASKAA